MTNDALFHIVLQRNKKALTALIAAILHLDTESINDVVVQNPLLQGHHPEDKASELDILVSFNNGALINLEMQVANLKNWGPRSLYYLCREFTRLHHGDDYSQVKPAYHIGFLDYTLFPDQPEFYATYRMCNLKTGNVYNDKFTLSVIELNHIDMATDEDKLYGIDKWARLFKATTWEDIKMLAKTDPIIESAAESIYSSVTEPWVLDLCRKSQEEIDGDIHRRERLAEQDKQIAEQDKQIAEQDKQIAEQDKQIAEKDKQIAEQDDMLAKYREALLINGIEVPE
ncbi:MAG: Rpn family recombination-promoting nuclease/putative transposase [Lachnospiraceae bacterium]|nr:Rpn family recombination-promoting nuclease/putative transposase [Lachnospiraceae bacterium]